MPEQRNARCARSTTPATTFWRSSTTSWISRSSNPAGCRWRRSPSRRHRWWTTRVSILGPRASAKGVAIKTVEEPKIAAGAHGRRRPYPPDACSILLSNAVKFTASGEVVIAVRCLERSADQQATVEWSVSDTGIGIAAGPNRRPVQGFHAGGQFDQPPLRRLGAGAGHLQAPGRRRWAARSA